MLEKIITNNTGEELSVTWDEERFALIHQFKIPDEAPRKVIILNPVEAMALVKFLSSCGKEE